MSKVQPELQIQKKIINYLNYTGKFFVFPVRNGATFDPVRKCYRRPPAHFIPGVSDIIGVHKESGRIICIEVKTPQRIKNVSEDQITFLNKINEFNGIAFPCSSVEECMGILEFVTNPQGDSQFNGKPKC